MSARTCSIPECGKTTIARGWCSTHYSRWHRAGDPLTTQTYSDPEDSYTARVAWDGEHLIWTGHHDAAGYGRIAVGGHNGSAHRYAWERVNGPIPDGMEIDHKCHVRGCSLVDHLRLATRAENVRNRAGAMRNSTTGARGVGFDPRSGRYQAYVTADGKQRHLGMFPTIDAASLAAQNARAVLFGEFAGRS